MIKPELLLPAGHPESFHAALEAGADAIYVGMKDFNARERANNFNDQQLSQSVELAHQKNRKVYITLNTLIKNSELDSLIEKLSLLEQIRPDAVIIQDWGVYYIIRHFFPTITIHASTQMGNHNSLGCMFAEQKKIERIIMARELTMAELQEINKDSAVELEVFIHGALCYSFSGMCLFSSFLGGQSANRGLCKQPCRRFYQTEKGQENLFNLKDNQQIDNLQALKKAGIKSVKVEGRLKSAEYVYRVGKAYRMALDSADNTDKARAMLKLDLGREKTTYFLSSNLKDAISREPYNGKHIGKIVQQSPQQLIITSSIPLEKGYRLRIRPKDRHQEGKAFKIKEVEPLSQKDHYKISGNIPMNVQTDEKIYVTEFRKIKFPSRFSNPPAKPISPIAGARKKNILNALTKNTKTPKSEALYVRIDSLAWLKKVPLSAMNYLILNFTRQEWKDFNARAGFLQKHLHKLIIELPKFIPQGQIPFYQKLIQQLTAAGYSQYVISHLSQKELFDHEVELLASEQVYSLNDAAVAMIKSENIKRYMLPFENEWENMVSMKNTDGIVPLYFKPALFYSRMPVHGKDITSDQQEQFHRISRDGITHVYPDIPVSLLQYTDKLKKLGFRHFLIDLSYEKPSGNRLNTIIKRMNKAQQIQPSTNFNFTNGIE